MPVPIPAGPPDGAGGLDILPLDDCFTLRIGADRSCRLSDRDAHGSMGSSVTCVHQHERNLDDQAPERIVTVATRATRAILYRPPFAQPVTGLCSTRVRIDHQPRLKPERHPCRTMSDANHDGCHLFMLNYAGCDDVSNRSYKIQIVLPLPILRRLLAYPPSLSPGPNIHRSVIHGT